MTKWTKAEIEQQIKAVRERAAGNADFRALALRDPRAAIAQVAGRELPAGFSIRFVDSDPAADMTVVLPPPRREQLGDADLARVVGGIGVSGAW